MFARLVIAVAFAIFVAIPAPAQTVHHVPSGGNLQAAIDAAQPGDTITLEPGATYVGNFVLPAKAGEQFVTIRSAAGDAALPGPGQRITPAAAALLPRLQSPNTMSVLRTDAGAHHYRLRFLELYAAVPGTSTILALGDGSRQQNTLASVPYALEVDRVYIHAAPDISAKRGIGLNSGSTTIVNSWIAQIKAAGQDSQAIGGWNGPGPYVISNNYLEAAGENVMFGGADPAIANLVPSDITFTGNHLFKPLSWRGSSWTVKNLFELKSAQRVLIDRNLFENNWAAAQTGSAILLKSVNQDGGAPWSVVQHVTVSNNVVRNVSSAVNILGRDPHHSAIEANHIVVRNNLFTNVSGSAFGGSGRLLLINGGSQITFDHNTVVNDGSSTVFADGSPVQGFVFTNNVLPDNGLGFKASGVGEGSATMAAFFPGAVVTGNIIANANAGAYPAGNFYPALSVVGFVDYAGGDYRLADASPYRNAASDGTNPGVDYSALTTPVVETPAPSSPPDPTPAPEPSPAPPAPPPSAPAAPGGDSGGDGSSGAGSGAPAGVSRAESTHNPHNVRVNVAGSTVTITWNAPSSGPVVQYLVEAGSGPGAANIARIATGNNATTLVAQDVPRGIYYVRVRGISGGTLSDPSGDASFLVGPATGCAAAPAPPTALRATVSNATVQLTWSGAMSDCAPSHYTVHAGSAPGRSDLAQISVGGTSLVTLAPPGVYYVRVMAASGGGLSAASNEIVVTVTP